MLRLKAVYTDDIFGFHDQPEILSMHEVFNIARMWAQNNITKQVDIYEDTKLIASIYG